MAAHDPAVFERITAGKVLYSQALQIIREENEKNGVKPRGGRNPKITKTNRSEFPIDWVAGSITGLGEFVVGWNNGTLAASFKSQTISDLQYFDFDEIDGFKKEVGATRYIFQSSDQKSSIHLIVNNPRNLFK